MSDSLTVRRPLWRRLLWPLTAAVDRWLDGMVRPDTRLSPTFWRIVIYGLIILAAVGLVVLWFTPGRFGMTPAAPEWLPEDIRR